MDAHLIQDSVETEEEANLAVKLILAKYLKFQDSDNIKRASLYDNLIVDVGYQVDINKYSIYAIMKSPVSYFIHRAYRKRCFK